MMDSGTAQKGGDWPFEVSLNVGCVYHLADTNGGHAERVSLHLVGMVELFFEAGSYRLKLDIMELL
jgi:hypothetical protein